jgi:signal transduction histidine kinase
MNDQTPQGPEQDLEPASQWSPWLLAGMVFVLFYIIGASFDVWEEFKESLADYEEFELDELPFALLGSLCFLVVWAVRARREADKLRAKAARLAQEARRANLAKSNFLAEMSHELRTPLNAILGFSEIIRDQMFGPTGDRRYPVYANDIHGSARHLLSMIDNLLTIAEIEAGAITIDRQALGAGELLDEVVAMTVTGQEADRVRVDQGGRRLQVTVDRVMTRRILCAFLRNALEHATTSDIVLTAKPGLFEVRDNGPGMSARARSQAASELGAGVNPYLRDEARAGFGLKVAHGLADLLGARITLDSPPTGGVVARLHMPTEPP